jgi:Asp-tRNA(Asn)/Glu-tRNA(Gln) amidotransferase A subunit family amidase
MSAQDLALASATELAALIRRKAASPVEVIEAVLARIDRLNPGLNAYCLVTAETARREAAAAEAAVMRGAALGPLHGVPFSVKDLVVTAGVRTTWGSRIYAEHVPRLRWPG